MVVMHVVVTQKNSLRVDDRRDITGIKVDNTWWKMEKNGSGVFENLYTRSEFNVRILGTEVVT